MMNKQSAVVFEAVREGYGIDQINHPMTVGELMSILEDYDEDTLVVLSHDNGYTYGSVSYPAYWEQDDEGEWAEY